jgi:ribosomal protein L24
MAEKESKTTKKEITKKKTSKKTVKESTGKLTKNIKAGDQVVVIAGRDKGNKGTVLEVDRKNGKVVVEDVMVATDFNDPNQKNSEGQSIRQTVTKQMKIDISNVKLA